MRFFSTGLPYIWGHPLCQHDRLGSTVRYLRWQIGSRLVAEPVIAPWVQGARLAIRRGMTGATGNLYCGLHEWPDMAFLLHLLRSDDRFVDVGANVGSYTVLASAAIGAFTVAIEASPIALRSLQLNVAVNGIGERVSLHHLAVGERSGSILFSQDRDCMNQVVEEDYPGPTVRVPMRPIDSLAEIEAAVLWKVDVEGFEREMLAGAARSLADPRLKAVLLEGRQQAVNAVMTAQGFQPAGYDPWSRTLTLAGLTQQGNQLWIRDPDWIVERLRTAPSVSVFGRSF
jgi:FkbM family methyltransferase